MHPLEDDISATFKQKRRIKVQLSVRRRHFLKIGAAAGAAVAASPVAAPYVTPDDIKGYKLNL